MKNNSKKIVMIMVITVLLFGGMTLWAQDKEHGRSADEIVAEIEQNQNVDTIDKINPDKVSPALLEELGDAVMSLMIPDEQQHEWMDRMMGGEGSEQLAYMHQRIGYNYLLQGGDLNTWGPGMMGGGFMGPGMTGRGGRGYGMMGWGRRGPVPGTMGSQYGTGGRMGWSFPWMWVISGLVVAGIVVIITLLASSGKSSGKESDSALDIVKSRYARGEITREEFSRIREELKEK